MILYFSIYLLTWNVVTVEPPPSEQLQSLLDLNADFIAIGLQEVKSQPQNLIADNLYEDSWTNSFRYELLIIHVCFLEWKLSMKSLLEMFWQRMTTSKSIQ